MTDAKAIKTTVRRLLLERDWTWNDLAKAAGMATVTAHRICYGSLISERGRRKIEVNLDRPLWTSPERFASLNRLAERLGCDPIATNAPKLRHCLRTLGVRCADSRKDCRAAIETLLAQEQSNPATAHA